MQSDDVGGFVAPELLTPPAEKDQEADPFQQLEAPDEEAPHYEQEGPDGETFEALEEEYRILASLRKRRDALKAAHSEASAEYEAHRGRMMRAMRGQGTRQFRSTAMEKGGCHFSSAYGVKIKDPSVFIPWAKKHCPELLSVNVNTLGSHVRKQYRDRGVPPDDPSFPPGLEVKEHDTLTVSVPKEK